MKPTTHLLLSWVVADSAGLGKRDRAVVTAAGIVADIDGAGVVVERLTWNTEHPLLWYDTNHHLLCHNLASGLLVTVVAFSCARERWRTAVLAFAAFHLHLLCDWLGARGYDGSYWPIYYWFPFSRAEQVWLNSWALASWQNMVITACALAVTLSLARKRGYSPLGIVWAPADRALVSALRQRFPLRGESPRSVAGGA